MTHVDVFQTLTGWAVPSLVFLLQSVTRSLPSPPPGTCFGLEIEGRKIRGRVLVTWGERAVPPQARP